MAEGTYEPADILTSARDLARFLLPDIGPNFTFDDLEIDAVLTLFAAGDGLAAAAILADQKALEVAGTTATTLSIGDTTVSRADGAQYWAKRAAQLRRLRTIQCSMKFLAPDGVRWEEVPHIFQIGQHDTPGSTTSTWSSDPDERWRR